MTSNLDVLRDRKRVLMARMREAQEAGDEMEAAMANEELLGVNAQMRGLMSRRRVRRGRDTSSQYAADRKQFEDWQHQEDGEQAAQARKALQRKASKSLEGLTKRQREILTLSAGGMRGQDIADQLGINKSTVSRTLARAKRNAGKQVSRAVRGERLVHDGRVDLRKPQSMREVVRLLTAKQLTYFYLYYSEGLTLRGVGELAGVNHTVILRTLRRALLRLDALFPDGAILEHPEALDEAAYYAWAYLSDHPETAANEQIQELVLRRGPPPVKDPAHSDPYYPMPDPVTTVRRGKGQGGGKLISALAGRNGLFGLLQKIFKALHKALRRDKGKENV